MFWKYSHQSYPQQIDYLLDKKDVTLQELLDEEDVLQECRAQNKKLIEFLIRPEIMEELVTLTTVEPTAGSGDGDASCDSPDEFTLYKYPNTACELFACDVPTLNERLAGDEALMTRLYSFLETEPPLNPLLASFFARTLGVLLTRNSEQNWYSYQLTCLQVLEFLKSREDFITLLLRHMGTSAIMDLMFKLFTSVEGDEIKLNLLNWLNGQQVIQRLIALFHPSTDSERHSNTAYLLCNIISKCRDNTTQADSFVRMSTPPPCTNIILNVIESPQTVASLLELMLSDGPNGEKSESSVVGGIVVLLEILDYSPNSRENGFGGGGAASSHGNREGENTAAIEEHKKMVAEIVEAMVPFLPRIHSLLLEPPPKGPVRTTAEVLTVPLGSTRLHVAKLICGLIAAHSPVVDACLIKLNTINVLLDLFFKYSWNNFLHTQVEHAISLALDIPKNDKSKEGEGKVEEGDWKDKEKSTDALDLVASEVTAGADLSTPVEDMQQSMETKTQEQGGDNIEDDVKKGKTEENGLVQHIFTQCNIVERILNAWDENEEEQSKSSGRRRGYMGHLIKIANHVVKVTVPPSEEEEEEETQKCVIVTLPVTDVSHEKEGRKSPLTTSSPGSSPSPPLSSSPPTSPTEKSKPSILSLLNPPVLDEATSEKWNVFVNSFLAQANATNNVLLGGEHPSHASPATNDEVVYGGSQIRQESVMQQVQQTYNQFQIQQIATMFTENYHDEEFTDEENTQHDAVDHVPSMAFNMSEDDLPRQAELFERLCAERMRVSSSCSSLDESDPEEEADEEDEEDEDDDERGRFNFVHRVEYPHPRSQVAHEGGLSKELGSSSDEDDHDDVNSSGKQQQRKEVQMEVDSSDPWAAMDPSSNLGLAPVAMDEAPNPWGDSTGVIPSTSSPVASVAPSGLIATPDDAAVGWADFGNSNALAEGFANFEANFGAPAAVDPAGASDENKNTQEEVQVEKVEEITLAEAGGCGDGSVLTEVPSQQAAEGGVAEVSVGLPSSVASKAEGTQSAVAPVNAQKCDLAPSYERFLFFSDVDTDLAVDPCETKVALNSVSLPESSSNVPSVPSHPVPGDTSQSIEVASKVGAIVDSEVLVALPQPSTESPANGPV